MSLDVEVCELCNAFLDKLFCQTLLLNSIAAHCEPFSFLLFQGAEYDIMQHFPFDQYTIRVLTAERPNQQLRTLLEEHGYIHLKELAWWGETLWAHKSTGLTSQHPKIAKIKTEERN